MQTLFRPLQHFVLFHGRTVPLQDSFDRVLKCAALLQEQLFDDRQKVALSLELLLRHPRKWLLRSPEDQAELFETIWRELMQTERPGGVSGPRAVDFIRDSDLIYSSFRQAYGIDLFSKRGKLSWWEFLALFQGLPSGTKMREVIDIRTRELPAATRHNQKEIQALTKLKAHYALHETNGDEYQSGVEKLFGALKRQAGIR